jgi:hypothetical protein
MTRQQICSRIDFVWEQDTSGVISFATAIRDMRAMMSLNLASNLLGIEGAKIIADILPKCT